MDNIGLLAEKPLFNRMADSALPILVRQAMAHQTITYSDLAREIGIHHRHIGKILGIIGDHLIRLSNLYNEEIPPIQLIVINKALGVPGKGVSDFISNVNYQSLSISEKKIVVTPFLSNIYLYKHWYWVLEELNLNPMPTDDIEHMLKAASTAGGGGESLYHIALKNFIAENPSIIGLPKSIGLGMIEYCLPSADTIDILFKHKATLIGIEVKSKISNINDIFRGLYQCVKYKHLIEATQAVTNKRIDSRVILVLENSLPETLIRIKNVLDIEVIENIIPPPGYLSKFIKNQ